MDSTKRTVGGVEHLPLETEPLLSTIVPGDPLCNEAEAQRRPDDGPPARGLLQTFVILGCSLCAFFIVALDHTILATLAGPIANSIGSLALLPYLSVSYILLIPPSAMLSGRISDIFGRGPVLTVSLVVFAAANVMCGVAQGPASFLAGRILAGGAAGPILATYPILTADLVPMRSRGVANGLASGGWGLGCILGGFLGGVIMETWGWRWAFWIHVPICVALAAVSWLVVDIPPTIQSRRSVLGEIDFVGGGLTVLFIFLLTVPVSAGGSLVPWGHPLIGTSLGLSAVDLAALVYWEIHHAHNPIIPVHLFNNRTILLSFGVGLITMMLYLLTLFNLPLFLQVMGQSASMSGIWLMLLSAGNITGGILCGLGIHFFGGYMLTGLGGMVVHNLGLLILLVEGLQGQTSPNLPMCIGILIYGAGCSLVMQSVVIACLAALDSRPDGYRDHASVMATMQFFRETGSIMGVAVPAAVLENVLRTGLWERFGDRPGAAEDIERVLKSVLEGKFPAGWNREGVLAAFEEAFVSVWELAVGLSLLATLLMAFMKPYRLKTTLREED